jgi:HEAT repeat protein
MENTVRDLNDNAKPDRWRNVVALEKMGSPAIDHIVKASRDDDKWVRFAAADVLGNFQDDRSTKALIQMLKDQDQDVRFAAAMSLGKIGDEKAKAPLDECSRSDNCFVRIAAEEALEKLTRPK